MRLNHPEYLLNHFEKLTRFLSAPGTPIDNNEAERELKQEGGPAEPRGVFVMELPPRGSGRGGGNASRLSENGLGEDFEGSPGTIALL